MAFLVVGSIRVDSGVAVFFTGVTNVVGLARLAVAVPSSILAVAVSLGGWLEKPVSGAIKGNGVAARVGAVANEAAWAAGKPVNTLININTAVGFRLKVLPLRSLKVMGSPELKNTKGYEAD